MTNDTTTDLTLADLGSIWPIPQLLAKPERVHIVGVTGRVAFAVEMTHDRISINDIIAQANARLAELDAESADETEFNLDDLLSQLDELDAQAAEQQADETDWDFV